LAQIVVAIMFAKEGNTLSRFKLAIKKYHYQNSNHSRDNVCVISTNVQFYRPKGNNTDVTSCPKHKMPFHQNAVIERKIMNNEELQKFCIGLIAQFQASGSAIFLVDTNAGTVTPGILEEMRTMSIIAQSMLQTGIPQNNPHLNGLCEEVCTYFHCTHAIVMVMFEQERRIMCSSSSPPEIFTMIMQNIVLESANTAQSSMIH
jgi:hypothetical protein